MLWFMHAYWRRQLSAYVDGHLSKRERRKLEGHLSACTACRSELQELHDTKDALRSLSLQEVPRSFALRPEQAEARPRPAPTGVPALALRLAGTALAAALAIVLVVDLADIGGDGVAMPPQEAAPARLQEEQAPLAPAEAPAPGEEGADAGYMAPTATTPPPPAAAAPEEGGLDPLRAAEIALAAALGAAILASAGFTLSIRRSR
jgi:anti-sigma factor RsiW